MRDGIAALRDRTTALLSRLAPPPSFPPAFDRLRRLAAEAESQRRRRLQGLAWAASFVLALGLGWMASTVVQDRRTMTPIPVVARAPQIRPVAPPSAPTPHETAQPPAASVPLASAEQERPVRAPTARVAKRAPRPPESVRLSQDSAEQAVREATLRVLSPTPTLELTRLEPYGRQDDLDGMWRTMSWDGAKAEAGERLPHIDGLPVVQVQVQSGEQSSHTVTVVAQQLSSGQMIRTIEGPATDVSQILSRHAGADVDSLLRPGDSSRDPVDGGHAMAMQVGDRMLAITGDLPADSLRAMIRRLNAEMRTK